MPHRGLHKLGARGRSRPNRFSDCALTVVPVDLTPEWAGFLLLYSGVELKDLQAQFERMLPLAVQWAAEQQERILGEGVPLSVREMADALKAGVKDPERIRLLEVEIIPSPSHPVLVAAYQQINVAPAAPRGLTLHYGIFVRSDYWRDRALILHELVHTAQYERLGGIVPFLRQYFLECATVGYNKSALEKEASTTGSRILAETELVRV